MFQSSGDVWWEYKTRPLIGSGRVYHFQTAVQSFGPLANLWCEDWTLQQAHGTGFSKVGLDNALDSSWKRFPWIFAWSGQHLECLSGPSKRAAISEL
jgi:hypothetical protein